MNIKTAENQLIEAKHLLEQARDLLSAENVSDEQRAEATSLRDRATKMKRDASLMSEIDREAKSMIRIETDSAREPIVPSDGFKSMGEWLEAAVEAKSGGQRDPRLQWMARDPEDVALDQARGKKALSGTAGATGGFLMPETFVAQMQAVMINSGLVMPRVTRIPMSSRTVVLPVLDHTQNLAAGRPRQFGGVIAFYQNEGDSSEESEPKFKEHTLTAHELTVYTEASNSLLADSGISLEAFMLSEMGLIGALNWTVEYEVFQGTGVGQPRGIIGAPVTISINRESANLVQYDDLADMDAAVIPSARLAWFASISVKKQLRTLQDPEGHYIWADAREGFPATLLGYPIFFTDKQPALGDTGDIVLGDFSYYLFGDRQAPTLDVSVEANFRRNRTAYRLIHRHDGGPWMTAPLTLSDGETVVSPFVQLDTSSAS